MDNCYKGDIKKYVKIAADVIREAKTYCNAVGSFQCIVFSDEVQELAVLTAYELEGVLWEIAKDDSIADVEAAPDNGVDIVFYTDYIEGYEEEQY